MTVLLPDRMLGIRRRASAVMDALGDVVPGAAGPLFGPWPGRASEGPDGRWRLAVDPAAWPVREHDLIEDEAGRAWVAVVAQLLVNTYDSTVDWVRVEALQVAGGGTEPGGAEFIGRG